MGMVAAGSALCVPGNHDEKLHRKLAGRNVEVKHGLAETLEQLDRETDAEERGRIARFPGRAGQPLRAGRRATGGGARGDAGAVRRPGQPAGAGVRALRRDDGRGGRGWPARAGAVGGRVPRGGGGRLRAYAHGDGRLAEQHHLPRHRLRLRRQPDGVAVAGADAGVSAGGGAVRGAGTAVHYRADRRVAAAGKRRRAGRGRRGRQAGGADAAVGERDGAGGERRGGAGDDEPVRGRPAVAAVPAADDEPAGDVRRAGAAGAPGRGVRLLPVRGRRPRRLPAEAHGQPGGRDCLPGRGGGPATVWRRRRVGHRLHPHRTAVLRRPGDRGGAAANRPRPNHGGGAVGRVAK